MNDNNVKKIMITVNGKPVGSGLWIDKTTYAPVDKSSYTAALQPKAAM
ncbi:hypothetical protein JJQ72_08520 [Paenibacillus sp. F411]|uniref:Uncharacterized protein n=1 Tax=Paenibacillus algicola TaxID=2565926 RepID=A0A4P8XI61_9BACL|nr:MULTISPECIES: hypothetical protein [Paenibacillus]MBO2944007.1 hypothetical protein [Paenibacillus sp. F411]QCT01893.1 hypothetical protein E6C60_1175 [Paenibacillus algicola]